VENGSNTLQEKILKSIDLLRSQGVNKIYKSNCSKYKFQIEIAKKLSNIYLHLGKNSEYFFHHPTHVLRHIGAHYWLSKTNYNYGIISEVGGWHTIDELKKSYGQIPPEKSNLVYFKKLIFDQFYYFIHIDWFVNKSMNI